MKKLALGTAIAVVGLVAAGLGLAGVATAAPAEPSPVSTAPASADAEPVPVPVVYQPVDAGDGFYGMRRGSVPPASTADLDPVPIVNQLPVIGVTPLPDHSDQATEEPDAEESDTAGTEQ